MLTEPTFEFCHSIPNLVNFLRKSRYRSNKRGRDNRGGRNRNNRRDSRSGNNYYSNRNSSDEEGSETSKKVATTTKPDSGKIAF